MPTYLATVASVELKTSYAGTVVLGWPCRQNEWRKTSHRNVGWSWLRYKDKLKRLLLAVKIAHNTLDWTKWRLYQNGIRNFVATSINRLRGAMQRRKVASNVPPVLTCNPHTCGLLCKLLAGLKCHIQHKHYDWQRKSGFWILIRQNQRESIIIYAYA